MLARLSTRTSGENPGLVRAASAGGPHVDRLDDCAIGWHSHARMLGFMSITVVAPTSAHQRRLRAMLQTAGAINASHPNHPLWTLVTVLADHTNAVDIIATRAGCFMLDAPSSAP
jgi:hypothetical protein